MQVIIDIECNSLNNPTQIWLIICKNITDGTTHVFRNVTLFEEEKNKFLSFAKDVKLWIGHNILGYDYPILNKLIGFTLDDPAKACCDTLVISKLVNYSREGGHSLEQYGLEFGLEKGKFSDWTKWSQEMEEYCHRDIDITARLFCKYGTVWNADSWRASLDLEHSFQLVVNSLHDTGFSFNRIKAEKLLGKVKGELEVLDKEIEQAFPPKLKCIREITPKVTKHGTLSKTDFRWVVGGDLSEYNGGPFCRCSWVPFNPSSHKQIVSVLSGAGWQPTVKTETHIDTERSINRLKYQQRDKELDVTLSSLYDTLEQLRKTGWKVNEENLSTLPDTAPSPARTLAQRILLEARRRTLTEWLGLVQDDSRIHGKFYGIGAWTHRMAHQQPNTANIPTGAKLYSDDMRSLWQAPRNRLLVGVDAEGIQLRIFAHYIDDPEFTDALVKGKKDAKTDPHSLNQRILGHVCKHRQDAKRFIYAYLLGAGIEKLSQILNCPVPEAQEGLDRLLTRYTGLAALKKNQIPADARRGYFIGLDGRKVPIPGDTQGTRKHLVMSGYLQNGEAVVMKKACVKFFPDLAPHKAALVNFVHDEWQTEVPNSRPVALRICKFEADSLREVGEELKLKCPLAGSYWNDDHQAYTIGANWLATH